MQLVILIGLQASGKTTFFRRYFAATHQHISKDLMRKGKNRDRRQAQLIETALQAGQSIVVDNTNPTLSDRASLIQLGQAYGVEIIGYYFESNVRNSLERNQHRTGKARVPDVGIFATVKKLVRPSYSEGFDQLFHVQITDANEFRITQWTTTALKSECDR
ncbi:hypothetical protein LEP3755_10160 [Leptolyngbya sp. NIES-3755]|nr:hypothetical protein LEP3755_10160 [Leptolyngbya sp. NIES-3755]